MPIAIIIILALLVVWWKYTLPILIITGFTYWLIKRNKSKLIEKVSSILTEISSSYRGKYLISNTGKHFVIPSISKNNPLVGYVEKFYIYGGNVSNTPSIRAHIKFLTWNDEFETEYKFVEKFNDTYYVCDIRSLLDISKESIEKIIKERVQNDYGGFLDNQSIEAKLCDILTSNWPEACWANESILKLAEPFERMSEIYNNSLENELMENFREKALKALEQMSKESIKLEEYEINALSAMKKAYQYLCVPSAVRSFENVSLDPLRIYTKGAEMRESFSHGVALQREIERL